MIAFFVLAAVIVSALFALIALVFPSIGRWLEKIGIAISIIMVLIAIASLISGQYWLLNLIVELTTIAGPVLTGAEAAWAVILAAAASSLVSYVIDPEGTAEGFDEVASGISNFVEGVVKAGAGILSGAVSGLADGLGINLGWLLAGAGAIGAYWLLSDDTPATDISIEDRRVPVDDNPDGGKL